MSDLIAALARCQAKFTTVTKAHKAKVPTKSGGEYTYTYANLADTLEMVLPILSEEGVALLQPMEPNGGDLLLRTELRKGDECVASVLPLHVDGLRPQEIGSLITYGRRYAITALLALATDDDDGNAAQAAEPRYRADGTPARRTAQEITATRGGSAPGEPATDSQRKFMRRLQNELGWSPVEASSVYLLLCKKDGPDVMTKAEASQVIDELNAVKKREKHVTFDDEGNPKIGTVAELAADEEPS